MDRSDFYSSAQMAQLEALKAYVAQVEGDDDFRGDPWIVEQGRVLLRRAVDLGLPLELCRDVQAIVRDYDDEAGQPLERRAAWFREREPIPPIQARENSLSM
jgi:hypothetical protein